MDGLGRFEVVFLGRLMLFGRSSLVGEKSKEFEDGCSVFGKSKSEVGSGLEVGDKGEEKTYGVDEEDERSSWPSLSKEPSKALRGESKSYSIIMRGFQTAKLIRGSNVREISEGMEIGDA
jgi:hypothetical protein